MAMALKKTNRVTACFVTIMIALGVISGVSYAEEEQEDSYYLSQMRDLANGKKGAPQVEVPASKAELMAETDLEEMAKAAVEVEKIDDITPALDKPALPALKPDL
ncbi:MAG TPA: hypothetical protein VF268_09135 [Gammaproteobacteria bacterium]